MLVNHYRYFQVINVLRQVNLAHFIDYSRYLNSAIIWLKSFSLNLSMPMLKWFGLGEYYLMHLLAVFRINFPILKFEYLHPIFVYHLYILIILFK